MTKKLKTVIFPSKILDSVKKFNFRHLENETATKIYIDHENLKIVIKPNYEDQYGYHTEPKIDTAKDQIEEMVKNYEKNFRKSNKRVEKDPSVHPYYYHYNNKHENSIALRREKKNQRKEIMQEIELNIKNHK
ncbi:hypothetical protein Glove_48g98 [Diversispora epigaea]|uniref:Uncharacterized protein n=1 Tax=Diversispora epigaea TaxID=1348612 RepID=A0A397JEA6_9GLOM|nr:hypothetical protein Glove_48g100 [Diversispora epigaea]RHZ86685.1 hypothetical protein Glove_48g98 [Diversispora epigaea]